MSRYLTPRLFAIHVLGAAAVAACLILAMWQWDRAHVQQSTTSTEVKEFAELSPLRDYLPAASVAVPTSVTGTWQPDERIVMADRVSDGPAMVNPDPALEVIKEWATPIGFWVVDIMELDDGSSLGVVRGFTTAIDDLPLVQGVETVSGVMQPSEDVPGLKLVNGIKPLTTAMIVENSRTIAHDGYLVSTSEFTDLELVTPIFAEPISRGLNWRNVTYTFNWVLFAVIVGLMWVRVARDEIQLMQISKDHADLTYD